MIVGPPPNIHIPKIYSLSGRDWPRGVGYEGGGQVWSISYEVFRFIDHRARGSLNALIIRESNIKSKTFWYYVSLLY